MGTPYGKLPMLFPYHSHIKYINLRIRTWEWYGNSMHQKFQVPKMEGFLNLIFGYFGGGFLHFRYQRNAWVKYGALSGSHVLGENLKIPLHGIRDMYD